MCFWPGTWYCFWLVYMHMLVITPGPFKQAVVLVCPEHFLVFLTLLGLLHVHVHIEGFLEGLAILGNNFGCCDQGVATYSVYVYFPYVCFKNPWPCLDHSQRCRAPLADRVPYPMWTPPASIMSTDAEVFIILYACECVWPLWWLYLVYICPSLVSVL